MEGPLFIMRSSLIAIFVTLVMPSFSIAAPTSLVGVEMPPVPVGCKHQESMLLGASDVFGYERLLCDGREVVVLQRLVERRGKIAYWKVIDELRLPSLTRGHVTLGGPLCGSASYKDETVFAIGRWTKAKDGAFVAKDISHAWRFNLLRGKIEVIPVRDVSCEGDNPD